MQNKIIRKKPRILKAYTLPIKPIKKENNKSIDSLPNYIKNWY